VIGGVFGDHSSMKTARVLLLGTAAAVSACHGDSGTPPPTAPSQHLGTPAARKGPSAEQLTRGMVEAASQGKSQLPVQLKFDLTQRPAVGQPLDIGIAVIPQIDASAAAVQVAGGDGLTVAADANPIDMPVEAGEVYRQSIKVTPTAEGVLLLSLTVSLKHDELTESRAFLIPLIVAH
jgi:hypothetical protein